MGSLSDVRMGLCPAAEKLVEGERVLLYTQEIHRRYPDGFVEILPPEPVHGSSVRTEDSGRTYEGMFGDKYPLMRYVLPDGRVLVEDMQASPWSSVPRFFLALRTEAEMAEAIG